MLKEASNKSLQSKNMTIEQYLSLHNIEVYFKDAVNQLLECRTQNIKVDPKTFLYDYFTSVREGTHTLYREFSFVSSTPHNRKSFISNFWTTFHHISTQGDLLSMRDYHALLCLLCPDFDLHVVQKTVRIILMDDATDCVMSFSDFIYAFQLQFCYNEFCQKCLDIFTEMEETTVADTDIDTDNASMKSDCVSGTRFLNALRGRLYTNPVGDISLPSEDIVTDILKQVSVVTYYSFMMALARNEKLCTDIGVLPCRPTSALRL